MRASAVLGILALLGAALARAEDLTGRAIFSYQTFDTGPVASDGFNQLYDARFERQVTEPLRIRLSLRAQDSQGGTDVGLGRIGRAFSQLQPAGELLYALSTFQAQANYDFNRLTSSQDGGAQAERKLTRATGRLSWRPDRLPGVLAQADRRGTLDRFTGIDRTETLLQGTVDYTVKGFSVAATSRRARLDDGQLLFARESLENQGLLSYDGSFFGGRATASVNGLISTTRLDERAQGGPVSIPTPVRIARASYTVDDTPQDDRDHPPVDLPALVDGNLSTSTGINLGPDGVSYHNILADLGRFDELDDFEIDVRDGQGSLVTLGGNVTWDVWVSQDGLQWAVLAGGATTTFVAPRSLYEVRFAKTTARYFKVVSFGLNIVDTQVTEIQAFDHTELGANEMRRTDLLLGSGTATIVARPVEKVVVTYYGLFNGLRQTSVIRGEETNRGLDQLVSAEVDPLPALGLTVRYQDRTLTQTGGLRQDYEAWTGIVQLRVLADLQQSLEVTRTDENNLGQLISTDGVTLHTYTRFYPSLDLSLDAGVQKQDYSTARTRVDRKFLAGTSQAQLLRSLKLTLTGAFSRSRYQDGVVLFDSQDVGLPPERDDRWTAEFFYRPGPQLGLAVRLGRAATEDFSATLQRYRLEWYPFRGGTVALGGTYDRDVDSVGRRQARRLTLNPTWTINRRMIFNVNYTVLEIVGDAPSRTRTFFGALTLTL